MIATANALCLVSMVALESLRVLSRINGETLRCSSYTLESLLAETLGSIIFEDRPIIEYVEADSRMLESAKNRAVEIALKFAEERTATLNGAAHSPSWRVFGKSLFAFILRDVGRRPKTRIMAGMAPDAVNDALSRFQNELENMGEDLYIEWNKFMHRIVHAIFMRSSTIFESYLLGTLSEKLYIGEDDASQLITELQQDGTVQTAGSRYGVDLLRLSEIPRP